MSDFSITLEAVGICGTQCGIEVFEAACHRVPSNRKSLHMHFQLNARSKISCQKGYQFKFRSATGMSLKKRILCVMVASFQHGIKLILFSLKVNNVVYSSFQKSLMSISILCHIQ